MDEYDGWIWLPHEERLRLARELNALWSQWVDQISAEPRVPWLTADSADDGQKS